MKHLILVGDGMADYPLPELDNRTPLEAAHTPALDRMAREGFLGEFCPIPDGMPAGSEIGNLSLFGYDPRTVFRGRAPLEAANQGIALGPNQVAFRCNLVTIEAGRMCDFTAGHIGSEEGAAIVASLNAELGARYPVRFYPGVGYRHLAIVDTCSEWPLQAWVDTACTPPHNIMDQSVNSHLPRDGAAARLRGMMSASEGILAAHPVNAKRREAGSLAATSIWLWGQGVAPEMEPFSARFGMTGAVVSAVDLVNGIGRIAGLEVLDVPGMTGWIDTNYEGKVTAALDALRRHDFVYVHIEAPDETAHQGRADLKVQAIEDYDAKVVAPCLAYLEKNPALRIFAAPDHFTLVSTKGHAPGAVPFAAMGSGIPASGAPGYTEAAAARQGICILDGYLAVAQLLAAGPPVFADTAASRSNA